MGKSHRDNHAARVKRGPVAFAKKAKRRSNAGKIKCHRCGTPTRPVKLQDGWCPPCRAFVLGPRP